MMASHMSQALTLLNPEIRIIQTGLPYELAKTTFAVRIKESCYVKAVTYRYAYSADKDISARTIMGMTVYVYEPDTQTLRHYEIKRFFSLHQYFGFMYIWKDILHNLKIGDYLEAGTVLADSPQVKNDLYNYGRNVNLLLYTDPDLSEDAIKISESCSKAYAYTKCIRLAIPVPQNVIPLNVHGDEHNYKAVLRVGDQIGQDGVIMALRTLNTNNKNGKYDDIPLITSSRDLREWNTTFDKVYFAPGPSEDIDLGEYGGVIKSGEVIEVEVYQTKKGRTAPLNTIATRDLEELANETLMNIGHEIRTYEEVRKNMRNINFSIDPSTSGYVADKLIIDTASRKGGRVGYEHRQTPIDQWVYLVTIKYVIVPKVGSKFTDLSGAKGICVEVTPDHLMPYDSNGVRADIVMDPLSIARRMNISRLYEQGFTAMARHTRDRIRQNAGNTLTHSYLSDRQINELFEDVLGLIKILDNEQYAEYSKFGINDKRDVIQDILTDELYLFYRISNKKPAYQIILEAKESGKYFPDIKTIYIPGKDGKIKVSKEPMLIAPLYIMLLAQTADTYLSVASPFLNNYKLPTGVNPAMRDFLPYRAASVRFNGETEQRILYYGGVEFAIEIKDRANNLNTHCAMYRRMLTDPNPTNVYNLINREEVPFGGDSALEIVNNVLFSAGLEFVFVKEKNYDPRFA